MNKRLAAIAPLLIFLALTIFLYRGLHLEPRKLPSNLLNKAMPSFKLTGLVGEEIQLSNDNFKGHWSLLNVWATWCLACRQDHGFLMQLSKGNIPIFGLDYKDDKKQARDWLSLYGNPYQAVGFDELGQVAINFGVYGTPETFLIDEHGIIRYRHVGILSEKVWQQRFLPLIERQKT